MQCQAQDAKFSQLNERIATTQCTRQCRQKWDIWISASLTCTLVLVLMERAAVMTEVP